MRNFPTFPRLIALALACAFAAGPVLAKDKEGDGPGQGQGRGQGKHAEKQREKAEKRRDKEQKQADKRDDKERRHAGKRRVEDVPVGGYFSDRHRSYAREYYTERYSNAKACPPGLAKKNNGCMPPGQARKLVPGQPVPAGVTLYPVPQPVIVQLPPPPYGYRYARVGNDIVLVRNENQLIVDIIVGLLNP
ncbi:DUF1236 domain-containing protein [Ramlibacter sp. RBP-2]|uniref:DUF1236 domain-containing protein n=1 Tax=Ramlibacter lithotrophicus TaxID=2606681 RepID=A0A7X6DHP7_9BURK|nr:RcnB family protein [Ramlibacter lithotrophicus]NKE67352.1 DUF1236 domain-containing protein [Ramlibacter lithotrophicus]